MAQASSPNASYMIPIGSSTKGPCGTYLWDIYQMEWEEQEDDPKLRKQLKSIMSDSEEVLHIDRREEILRHTRRSDYFAACAAREMGEAISAASAPDPQHRLRPRGVAAKAVRQVLRMHFVWRCASSALGLDSMGALSLLHFSSSFFLCFRPINICSGPGQSHAMKGRESFMNILAGLIALVI